MIGSVALVCWPLPGGLLDLIVEERSWAMAAYRLAVVCDRLKTRARCRGSGSVQDPERRSAILGSRVKS